MTAIAAHRGGARLWPENSLAAVRGALALGVEEVEVDVHLSADDVPVVLHDATLDRTTDGRGAVRAQAWDALRAVRLRGADGGGLPTLAAVATEVAAAGRVLRLEVKGDAAERPYPGAVAQCLQVLDGAGMRGRTVLIGFAEATVAEAAGAGFRATALLVSAARWRALGTAGAVARARACGAGEIGLPLGAWSAADVAAVRGAGLAASAWGADDAAGIAAGLALGLDVLTTDDPARAWRMRGG